MASGDRVNAVGSSRAGYRRRILILPGEQAVTAELEDDYHRMAVTIGFADGIISAVDAVMKRSPWNTCPGAIAQLRATFLGRAINADVSRADKVSNCTHLFDLAQFALGHAGERASVAYNIEVADVVDGRYRAQLWRNGERLYDWHYSDEAFLAPAEMVDLPVAEIGRWIVGEPADRREAAKILRWASMVAKGRQFAIVDGSSATRFASGACFNLQPAMAALSRRRPGAAVDFSATAGMPLADREDWFTRQDCRIIAPFTDE